jgi:hypothetical protein
VPDEKCAKPRSSHSFLGALRRTDQTITLSQIRAISVVASRYPRPASVSNLLASLKLARHHLLTSVAFSI